MPALEDADLVLDAVLFERTATDSRGQAVVSSTPKAVKCWWVKRQGRMMSPTNSEVAYDVQAAFDCDVEIGSIVWRAGRGRLCDYELLTPPVSTGLYQVVDNALGYDVKGNETRREYKLVRFARPLPTA